MDEIRERLQNIGDPVALLTGLFALSPLGFQVLGADGRSVLTNEAFRLIFGTEPPAEYNVFKDEIAEQQGITPLIRRAFAGETLTTPSIWYDPRELKHVRLRAGKRVAITATLFPLVDSSGEVQHVAIAFKDVTTEVLAQEAAEAKAREAEAAALREHFLSDVSVVLSGSLDYLKLLQRVAELAAAQIADWCTVTVVDEGGTSRRVAAVHRDPAKAELIQEYLENFSPENHRNEDLHEVVRTGRSLLVPHVTDAFFDQFAQDERHRAVLQALGCCSCIMVPMVSGGKPMGVLSLLRSSPERPFEQADLVLAQELAYRAGVCIQNARLYSESKASVHVRDDFLSIVGHELRTPLAALLMQIQSMQRAAKVGELFGSRMTERLDKAERSALRLKALINQVLDVSRISAGKLKLERHSMNLSDLVEEVVSHFRDLGADEAGRLIPSIESGVVGEWDALRLEQAIANLLSNAVKYGQGLPVEVKLWTEAGEACLSVKDFGIGIAPEEQQRLFSRFERAVASKAYGGIGLGLWIVRQTVEASGGRIQLKSAEHQGAEFTVRLPLHSPGAVPETNMSLDTR